MWHVLHNILPSPYRCTKAAVNFDFVQLTKVIISQSWLSRLRFVCIPMPPHSHKNPLNHHHYFPAAVFFGTHIPTTGIKLHTGKFSIGSLMKKRQYGGMAGYTGVVRLSGSHELAIPPVIISAASSLKLIAGFSAHQMYRRGKALAGQN